MAQDELFDFDPIVLVVPRHMVTEGVCERLGFGGESSTFDDVAHQEMTLTGLLQIEFQNEAGQDQGGLMRAWLELAAAHFVQSDFTECQTLLPNSSERVSGAIRMLTMHEYLQRIV